MLKQNNLICIIKDPDCLYAATLTLLNAYYMSDNVLNALYGILKRMLCNNHTCEETEAQRVSIMSLSHRK